MLLTNGLSLRLSLALGVFAFALDRGHKYFQIEMQQWVGGEYRPITGFFDYVLVWNTGISYGLFSALPVVLVGLVMAAAIAALVVWWAKSTTLLTRSGLALCIGGAVSNALDRVIYGAVADFFHFHLGEWSFYIFNIADTAITFGVLLLFLDLLGIGRSKAA